MIDESKSSVCPCATSRQRLSKSPLWRWQRNYFESHGIRAWTPGAVPYHITSCPFIARSYSRVVLGFLRDCAAAPSDGERSTVASIDPTRPIYIVELGSGSGRFG
jgi:hypothetical protein